MANGSKFRSFSSESERLRQELADISSGPSSGADPREFDVVQKNDLKTEILTEGLEPTAMVVIFKDEQTDHEHQESLLWDSRTRNNCLCLPMYLF